MEKERAKVSSSATPATEWPSEAHLDFVFLRGSHQFQTHHRELIRKRSYRVAFGFFVLISLEIIAYAYRPSEARSWFPLGFWMTLLGSAGFAAYGAWFFMRAVVRGFKYNYFPDPSVLIRCIRNMERAGDLINDANDDERKLRLSASYSNAATQNQILNTSRNTSLTRSYRALLVAAGFLLAAGLMIALLRLSGRS